jgi:hypothetical protein
MSKSIGEQFVPLLHSTLDCKAWRAMSPGARLLYIALKRRVPRDRNRAYISQRQAMSEVRTNFRHVGQWFRELQHFGFIVQASPGCLGVDGKGKSPHWRLTELGNTSKTGSNGLLEHPTRQGCGCAC